MLEHHGQVHVKWPTWPQPPGNSIGVVTAAASNSDQRAASAATQVARCPKCDVPPFADRRLSARRCAGTKLQWYWQVSHFKGMEASHGWIGQGFLSYLFFAEAGVWGCAARSFKRERSKDTERMAEGFSAISGPSSGCALARTSERDVLPT